MKKIMLTIAFMGMTGYAHAIGGASAANVAVMESTMTAVQVSISSSAAVDITALANSMPDRTTIVIQNVDTASNIFCGGAGVTATTGFLVAPGGSISINVRPYSQKYDTPIRIYCISASTTGPTKAAIIQGF